MQGRAPYTARSLRCRQGIRSLTTNVRAECGLLRSTSPMRGWRHELLATAAGVAGRGAFDHEAAYFDVAWLDTCLTAGEAWSTSSLCILGRHSKWKNAQLKAW